MAMDVPEDRVRRDYCLHSDGAEAANEDFDASGFIRIAPAAAGPGDMLLVRAGKRGLHLVLLTDTGHVHADMRLRRTVEAPGKVPWPVISAWRHPSVAVEDPLAPELVGTSEAVH